MGLYEVLAHVGKKQLVEACPLGTIATLLGDGEGAYTVNGEDLGNNSGITAFTVGDMNADGKPDIIFYGNELIVRLGNGDGTFASPIEHPLNLTGSNSQFQQILVADFNRDGKPDLLILDAAAEPGQRFAGNITLYLGTGGGKLTTRPQYLPETVHYGIVLNLNGDTAPDIAATTIDGVTRLLNSGSRATVTK